MSAFWRRLIDRARRLRNSVLLRRAGVSILANRFAASGVHDFPVIPADLFFSLKFRKHAYSTGLGTPAGKPITPTKLTLRLAFAAWICRTLAVANRAVFAA